MPLIIEGPYLF